jgi:accessory gene regulator B
MIHMLAEKAASNFIMRGIVEKEDADIYLYAFEIMLSTAASLCASLAIALLFRRLPEWAVFTAVFVSLRRFAGGHHAQSHLACIATYAGIFACAMALIGIVPQEWNAAGSIILCAAFCPLIYAFAPIRHENKPNSAQALIKFRKRGRVLAVAVGAVCVLGAVFASPALGFAAALAVASVCASMVYAMLKSQSGKEVGSE